MQYVLGVDIGTNGAKAVLLQGDGQVVQSSKTYEYPMYQPAPGWAEEEPEDWWRAVTRAIQEVLFQSGIDAAHIVGVGLSGQFQSIVLLDRSGRVLRRSILWCDQRTGAEREEIHKRVGKERLVALTAGPALVGSTVSMLMWVRKHEPAIYERCAHVMIAHDYIRYRLTGEFATDVTAASSMQLLDVPKRQWSGEVLTALEVDRSLLGTLYESPEVAGKVHRQAAEATGLAEGTIVVGGGGDSVVSAVGTGVATAGAAFTSLGTSGIISTVTDDFKVDPEGRFSTYCSAAPGKWVVLTCTVSCGLSLRWLRDTCCAGEVLEAEARNTDPYLLMDRLAATAPIGADGLLFLPYLIGERSPYLDENARGGFIGLTARHTRANLIRAVLEGVAFSLLDCIGMLREAGIDVRDHILCGGGSKSPFWRQILADVYGRNVITVQNDGGSTMGAAILASVGAGIYGSVEEACATMIHQVDAERFDQENHRAYQSYYRIYQGLYALLKETNQQLAALGM